MSQSHNKDTRNKKDRYFIALRVGKNTYISVYQQQKQRQNRGVDRNG